MGLQPFCYAQWRQTSHYCDKFVLRRHKTKLMYHIVNCDVCFFCLGAPNSKTNSFSNFMSCSMETQFYPHTFRYRSKITIRCLLLFCSFKLLSVPENNICFYITLWVLVWRISMKIFLLFFVVTSCSGFNVDTFVGTVIAMKQYFRSGCVYTLHDQRTGKSI